MRVQIYDREADTGDLKLAGTFTLRAGKICVDVVPGKERLMQSILDEPAWARKRYLAREDPEGFLRALPLQYGFNCTMVQAVLIADDKPG
jgi:hypothetical protein